MTERNCETCKHEMLDVIRKPCSDCMADPFCMFEAKEPKEPNYGSCRDNHLTHDGDCAVYRNRTPCLQWDCNSWSNEPAKTEPDDNMARLKWLMVEFIILMDLYAERSDQALRATWYSDIAPALMDRIEARARAAFGGEL